MVIMEPAPPRSLRPNQRRADSGSLSVTQGDTQTLTLLCMRAPFTPARSSAAAATSTGPARSVAARDAQPPGPNDVEPAGRRPCRRVRRLVVAEQRSQLQPPDVVLSLLRVSWVQKCAPSSHRRGTTSPLPHHPVRHLLDPRALGLRPESRDAKAKSAEQSRLPRLHALCWRLVDDRVQSFSCCFVCAGRADADERTAGPGR